MLAATLVPALVVPGVAAAVEPSVPLSPTSSVAVQPETGKPARPPDQASRRSLTKDQQAIDAKPGANTPAATSLSPSATWEVAAHTGDFSWSYPLRVPPAPGGLEPSLALSYRSSAVDGRTSVSNNQPSWIGEGWDLWPGFIERTYGACVDDDASTGDLCWKSDNATAAYNGGGGMLICCDGDKKWRAKNDDGARIERVFDGGVQNGDDDHEYWKVTTVDGTQYWFGTQADSTWTVPVFGDDVGEPCHKATFDASSCTQAYRWNLDKVVDRNGNMIRYFYTEETNKYGINKKDAPADYVRGGALEHIEYGLNERVGGQASGRVEFGTSDRCVRDSVCTQAPDKRGNWPDTPLKLACAAAPCTEHSPSFWTTKRLDTITTKVLRGSTYDPVDRWTLDQQFPGTGELGQEQREAAALWLNGIRHTGLAGVPIELPPVTFEGTLLPNRVDGDADGYAGLNRYRVSAVISETGGVTTVNYETPDCKAGQTMPAETNSLRCFPVRWSPSVSIEPRTDYFHKYVVASVTQSDMIASSAEQLTTYEYLDGAAWHWDMSEFVKDDKKTWNEFRGFGRVRIRTGRADDPGGAPITMSEQRFYRGMDGDRLNRTGGTKPVAVSDSVGDGQSSRTDSDWLQGFGFETTTFAKEAPSGSPNPPWVGRSVSYPVAKGPTATRGVFKSYLVRPETQRGFSALNAGGWRETKTTTHYDNDAARGLRTSVDDVGDVTKADDDRCTRTTYAPNTTDWQLDLAIREETVAVACGSTVKYPDHAVSDAKFGYDGRGNLNKTEIAKEHPASGPAVYLTTATASYDKHGRATETIDVLGSRSTVSFTPTEGGPVTASTATGPAVQPTLPAGLAVKAEVEPAFGTPTKIIDGNAFVTQIAYDALGRSVETWLPNRPKTDATPKGSLRFDYLIRRDAPSVVTTTKIGPNGVFVSSNAVFDGLLRPRQTQAPAVGMRSVPGKPPVPVEQGRLITDTRYDSHGRAYKATQSYFNDAPVDTNLWRAADAEVPGLTRTKFDGAGRAIESIYQAGATENRWSTKTDYDGDRVSVIPPAGGTATTTITDARGRATELRQYHGPAPTGDFDVTRYKYTPAAQVAEVTGPDGAVWKYGYDLRGRAISGTDPDSGTSTKGYDDADRLVSTKDALGRTLAYDYDALNRKTALSEVDGATRKLLAKWTYDTVPAGKGQPATSTRYVGENAYTSTIDAYTPRYQPLYTSVTIPAAEGALAGTYNINFGYGEDGTQNSETYPRVPGTDVGAQTVNHAMDDWGRPIATRTGAGQQLVAGTYYTRYGEPERIEQGVTPNRGWQSFYYNGNNRRLERSIVDAEVPQPKQADVQYTYNDAGSITSMAADVNTNAPDIQCFRYDHLRRLTEAWTAAPGTWSGSEGPRNGGCTAEPTVSAGPAPYWDSYKNGPGGNRLEETTRGLVASAKRTYDYPAADQPQPHTLRSASGPAGTQSFTYNSVGQTTRRVAPGSDQTLTWDRESHLAAVTEGGGSTSFIYTAGGDRLLRKDPGGSTLYLGKQEIRLDAGTNTLSVTRYYTHGSAVIAMQQGKDKITWLAADHQGTTQTAIDPATLTVARRRQTPYGAPRGAEPTWPGERGFVGGTKDASTGLTHLGAREYDPSTGRFISVDPVMKPEDPQQMQGYAYANNSPVSFSDPTGLILSDCGDSSGSCNGLDPWTGAPAQTGGAGAPKQAGGTGPPRKTSRGYRNDPNYLEPRPDIVKCGGPGTPGYFVLTGCIDISRTSGCTLVDPFNGKGYCRTGETVYDTIRRQDHERSLANSRKNEEERHKKSSKDPLESFLGWLEKQRSELFGRPTQAVSICVTAAAGLGGHAEGEICLTGDNHGVTLNDSLKLSRQIGGGASAGFGLKFHTERADQVNSSFSPSVAGGVEIVPSMGGGVELETDSQNNLTTSGNVSWGGRATFGPKAYLEGMTANLGYIANWNQILHWFD
ncbi:MULTISPECIES: RHS repeat-associated core domain-containing protein [Amycolatopsis]|uniref:RHS repeat-associated core domain-containing protein n=1 Tax=Amycolatopsis TaxID=1813 RepID=UPI00174AA8B5|nr:RHS repeat-associated core domain-containing protein [Amycolatopsis bullii]